MKLTRTRNRKPHLFFLFASVAAHRQSDDRIYVQGPGNEACRSNHGRAGRDLVAVACQVYIQCLGWAGRGLGTSTCMPHTAIQSRPKAESPARGRASGAFRNGHGLCLLVCMVLSGWGLFSTTVDHCVAVRAVPVRIP